MNNSEYLNSLKPKYESLTNMYIKNNVLYYDRYILPLIINLNTINPDLFLLSPEEIINTIYIIQLLYKPSLNEIEKNMLIRYTHKYNELNNQDNKDFNMFGLSIPIFISYDENFQNSPGATIIRAEYTKICEQIELQNNGGKSKELIRVRKNKDIPNSYEYYEYIDFSNNLDQMQNAGFVTIFIIFFGIILSTLILAII